MKTRTKRLEKTVDNRTFGSGFKKEIQKMENYLMEIEYTVVFGYGLCGKKRFLKDSPIFNDFLGDNKFHSINSKFNDLLYKLANFEVEDNLEIITLAENYYEIQSMLEPVSNIGEPALNRGRHNYLVCNKNERKINKND